MRSRVVVLAAVALLAATVAAAQPELPRENHYAVYYVDGLSYEKPLKLMDQFATYYPGRVLKLEKWSNPATKVDLDTGAQFPPVDPVVHQTWWRVDLPGTPRDIVGIDQFGTRNWRLDTPEFLLNPALKNVPYPADPPTWNHYLCYRNQIDEVLPKLVGFIDQFGAWQVVALYPTWFCNPVEKTHLDDGKVYPIVDPKAHLACYIFHNQNIMPQNINVIDQFANWLNLSVHDEHCLCVPALKEIPIRTEESTWGRIKALYN